MTDIPRIAPKIRSGSRASELRYRRLFESAPHGILILDAASRKITDVNPYLINLLEYSRDEILGRELWELGLLKDEEASKAAFLELREKGYIRYGDLRLETDLGLKCEVEFISSVYDEGGVQVIQCNIRDITGRRAAAIHLTDVTGDLESASADFKRLVDNSLDVMCQMNDEGRFVSVSNASSRVWGYDPAEIVGTSYWELVHPEDTVKTVHAANNTMAGKPTSTFENRTLHKDGSIVYMMWSGYWSDEDQVMYCVGRDVSEIRIAEAALLESEANYRTLIESLPAIVYLAEPRFPYSSIYISPYVAAFGPPPEAWMSQPDMWLSTIHEDDRERVLSEAKSAISAGGETELEYRLVTPDGTIHWMRDRGQVISDEEGEPAGWQRVILDVTSAKMAEAAQVQAAALQRQLATELRILFDLMPSMIWVKDAEDNIVRVNKMVADSLGKQISEIEGRPSREIYPHFGEEYSADDLAVMNSKTATLGLIEEFSDSNGNPFWMQTDKVPYQNDQGDVIGLIVSSRDITEQVRHEQELIEGARRLAEAQRITHLGSWEWDILKNTLIWSAETYKIMGVDPDMKVTFPHMLTLIHPADRGVFKKSVEIAVAGGEPHDLRIRVMTPSREEKVVRCIGEVTFDSEARAILMMGSVQDITSTAVLENQLLQSQKMEAVGQMAGGIAHDFNNMLTAINGYSDLTLRKMKGDDPLRSNIEQIKKAGSRSAELTNQLLAFSRKQILRPEVVDFNELITETNKMLERLIGEDIELVTVLSPKAGQVKADPGQISQVLINLAINARDAMPLGGKLTFETRNVFLDDDYARLHSGTLPGAYVMLAVSDTGVGMSAEVQRRMFEPFFTTKTLGSGTGLGLASVYGIVKQSGGNISVYSEVGHGTTVKLYLPRAIDAAEERDLTGLTDEMPKGTETILLVEDEEIVRTLTCQILELCGYTVLSAHSGIEALAICEDQGGAIDLLMTDVVMPGMGGRELSELVTEKYPTIKVLFASGYTDDAIVRHGVIGANTNFVQKPFSTNQLARKVRGILDS